jgi:XTP/dITP diphosphohydrolase
LASNNRGKLAELQAMLAPLDVELVRQADLGIPRPRSRTAPSSRTPWPRRATPPEHSGLPALADDAGLCVDAFGGLPGVDTAYYATQFGYEKGDDNNVRALLEQMQGIANRRAAMVSTLVAVRSGDDPEPLIAVGRVVGEIAREPVGQQRLRLRPGDVHPRVRADLCAIAGRGEERAQPPREGGPRHAGADPRALVVDMTHTPKLRALRVAALPPLQGATPAARQSRFRGVSGRNQPGREDLL